MDLVNSEVKFKTDLGDLLATPGVPLRQCFLAVAALAQAQGPVNNTTPKSEWGCANEMTLRLQVPKTHSTNQTNEHPINDWP